ncbi:MAG: hypothetical protein ABIK93_01275 [candidate division WOR-3 bacterium]
MNQVKEILGQIISKTELEIALNDNKCSWNLFFGLSAIAILLFCACIPPIAYHDGLPVWVPEKLPPKEMQHH